MEAKVVEELTIKLEEVLSRTVRRVMDTMDMVNSNPKFKAAIKGAIWDVKDEFVRELEIKKG